jgi:hypothetical protein
MHHNYEERCLAGLWAGLHQAAYQQLVRFMGAHFWEVLGPAHPMIGGHNLSCAVHCCCSWAEFADGGMKDFKELPLLSTVGTPRARSSCSKSSTRINGISSLGSVNLATPP